MDLNPYDKFLGGQEPIPILTTTVDRLRGLTAPLSPALIDQPPTPGKWSIREITVHLADCEIVFAFRLRQTLSEEHSIIQPFDQERWGDRYGAYNFVSAMETLQAVRFWNLRLLTTVSEDDRHHPTTHPERGTMTFWTVVETMAGHDINHLKQIERIAGSF